MTIGVLIVEDEPEFLRRFSDAVLSDSRLQLLGAVSTGQAARAVLEAVTPDVLLIDLGLPDMDGVDLIRHVAQRHPQCDIVVVTMFADDTHVMTSLEAGATGYLLKDAHNEHIAAAVHEAHEGGAPISPSIARRILRKFRLLSGPGQDGGMGFSNGVAAPLAPAPNARPAQTSPLSERETEILRLVAKGFSFETVGHLLAISPHTVVTHVKKIYRKLAVHSRGEAVYEANQLGLL